VVNFEQVKLKVNELLAEGFEIPLEKLVPDAELKKDLGLDSLDAVDMLVILEEKIEMKVDGEKLQGVVRLQDVYNLVWDKIGPKVAASDGTNASREKLKRPGSPSPGAN
jgi:acyl carrier protein